MKQADEMNLWVIVSGCYSGWNLEGYCTTRESALKLCAKHNWGDPEHVLDCLDEWYPMEMRCLDAESETASEVLYEYPFRFQHENGAWTMSDRLNGEIKAVSPELDRIEITDGRTLGYINLKFRAAWLDPDRARKAAQDRFYQYLVESEGL